LIKSIAEQGYSLESALADLMDNSVSANADKIEILIKMDHEPFTLFLVDNGNGMDEETLKSSMHFPSNSPDSKRCTLDLGRFGLGMKTASFSQTRKFTVISKEKNSSKYSGRTWDLNLLKSNRWNLLVNSDEEISNILQDYREQSENHLDAFDDFEPNTLIIWYGLYKYEDYIEKSNRTIALKREITEVTTDHLSLVFHRFMERKKLPLQIRVNNIKLTPFNPFPTYENDLRSVEFKQKGFGTDSIKLEGFVLPSRSIDETKESSITKWTTRYRSLTDMEGIYIYRADRIILFGGWNGLIKRAPKLQLARLRVEIGNSVDHLLHLNVAKSQVIIPHDLIDAFESYINDLKVEATKEFYNRGTKKFPTKKEKKPSLFERTASNKGMLLELNMSFPIINSLNSELNKSAQTTLKILLKMINTQINKIRQSHEDKIFLGIEQNNEISTNELLGTIKNLVSSGIELNIIKTEILPNLGYKINSFPNEILEVLNDK
jgi:Histidine kinase-, DNA gyrase B-, and HSP90-like ATPase